MSVLGELKRRKMFQVAAVYLVIAWLIMQVIDVIHEPLRLPEWFPTVVIVLLAIGFPLTMIISWAFNVTPGGVVRDSGHAESSHSSGRTIEFVLIGLVGIAVVWLIYRTEFDTRTPPEPVAVENTAPDLLPNSIAVLPFANLSPDPDNAFFAAGIHDTILNELAKIRDMHVISRTTMMRYADTEKSMPQIAEELRVETVMEGSVQYANGRVLVTAQLINPQTDSHIWSGNYDREFADVFRIQADIATRIADALQAQISPEERQSIQQQMTDSPEAYATYLQAMDRADWDLSPADAYDAEFLDLLDKAIELDPNFALPYAIKAHMLSRRYDQVAEAEIISLAERALELDPDLGLAYSAFAFNHRNRLRDNEAREAWDKALSLSPNDPNILDDMSRFLAANGDFDDALALANRLIEIDPGFSSVLLAVNWTAGNIDAAVRESRRLVQLDSSDANRRLQLAVLELLAGNKEAAMAQAAIASNLGQSVVLDNIAIYFLPTVAYRYHLLGLDDDAERILENFFARTANEEVPPVSWAFAFSTLGDYEKVLEQLLIAAEDVENGFRNTRNQYFAANPYYDPELEKPEFIEVRRRLGFPKLVDRSIHQVSR